MDKIDLKLAHLDLAIAKVDKKIAKAAVPAGAFRQILHRGPDHRVTYVDNIPLDQIPESER